MSARSGEILESKFGTLLPAAARAVVQLYRPYLEPLNLTHPQFLVLLVLNLRQPRTVGEIGQQLALSSATLSALLKRLEAIGLISRTRSKADERRLAVSLTDAGRALIPQLRAIRDRVNDVIGLSPADRHRLQLFIASLPDATQEPDGDHGPRSGGHGG
jgi:DNA-binding MarR family transcriptional regulator